MGSKSKKKSKKHSSKSAHKKGDKGSSKNNKNEFVLELGLNKETKLYELQFAGNL